MLLHSETWPDRPPCGVVVSPVSMMSWCHEGNRVGGAGRPDLLKCIRDPTDSTPWVVRVANQQLS